MTCDRRLAVDERTPRVNPDPMSGACGWRGRITFDQWLQLGYRRGWIAEATCWSHNPVTMTVAERVEFASGGAPCVPVLRIWLDSDGGVE